MKYVRYSIAALGLLIVLLWCGNWIFAKEYLGSPFAAPTMARGVIIWGALAFGILADTWKKRIVFAGAGALAAWALLHGAFYYNQHVFSVTT